MKTTFPTPVVLALLLACGAAWGAEPAKPPAKLPTDAECAGLGTPTTPFSFGAGEELEFALDALGAQAGKMTMRVLPSREGQLPVEVRAQTNTFFSKVRRVTGVGTSYLNPRTLRPVRYVEEAVENEVPKYADVTFPPGSPKNRVANLDFRVGPRGGKSQLRYTSEGLDVAGAIYLLRQLSYRAGAPLCFDAYGIRRMWRVFGKVEKREHVSMPLGEFDAWHLVATAARLDNPSVQREVHVWITDDARRLPLAALGALDIGAVRATLTAFSRPGDKTRKRAEGKEQLKW
jgi:hypothetical protein